MAHQGTLRLLKTTSVIVVGLMLAACGKQEAAPISARNAETQIATHLVGATDVIMMSFDDACLDAMVISGLLDSTFSPATEAMKKIVAKYRVSTGISSALMIPTHPEDVRVGRIVEPSENFREVAYDFTIAPDVEINVPAACSKNLMEGGIKKARFRGNASFIKAGDSWDFHHFLSGPSGAKFLLVSQTK